MMMRIRSKLITLMVIMETVAPIKEDCVKNKVDLAYRDFCSHKLIPLNKCRCVWARARDFNTHAYTHMPRLLLTHTECPLQVLVCVRKSESHMTHAHTHTHTYHEFCSYKLTHQYMPVCDVRERGRASTIPYVTCIYAWIQRLLLAQIGFHQHVPKVTSLGFEYRFRFEG